MTPGPQDTGNEDLASERLKAEAEKEIVALIKGLDDAAMAIDRLKAIVGRGPCGRRVAIIDTDLEKLGVLASWFFSEENFSL